MSPKNSITIRVGQDTLSFSIPEGDGTIITRPYAVKSGMSLAANLRAAFRSDSALTEGITDAHLVVASPSLLIPMSEYRSMENFDADTVYGETITGHKGEVKIITEIPELDVVSVFPVNNDLQMVVKDNYLHVDTENVMTSVWLDLYKKYYVGNGDRRLFIYFHDKVMDVCSFEQHRIRFANNFSVRHAHDALYFALFVWKQLGMNQQEDELFVLGEAPHNDWFQERVKSYVKKVNFVNNENNNGTL